MFLVSNFYGICGIMEVAIGVLRGMGYSFVTMITSLLGSCGLRIVWVNTVFAAVGTTRSLYICYPITWGVTGLVLLVCFFVMRPKAYAKAQLAASGKE